MSALVGTMDRIQLHLSEDQSRRLNSLARARGTTRAALIRQGIDWVLRTIDDPMEDPLMEMARHAGPGGEPHGAVDHDRILYGAPKKGRGRRK